MIRYKRLQIKRKGIIEFVILTVLLMSALLFFFTCLGVTDEVPEIVSLWVICLGSGLIWMVFRWKADGMQSAIIYAGYLCRCFCMLIDLYGREYITILHSGGDSETFAQHASLLYKGEMMGWVSTKYPYVINGIYQVLGENRLCAQYINVIFWVLSAGLLMRICSRFQVRDNRRNLIYAIWSFLPTGILLSGILLRESAEMFFGMWSFERFLCWMGNGRRKYCIQAFLFAAPAIILHSASVALWITYVAVMMFWDADRQRYRWQIKTYLVLCGCVAGMLILRQTPVWTLLFSKLGSDFSLYGITHRVFYAGGSDYLTNMECQSWFQFVPDTLIRMFYFLFSPLPMDVRGIKDFAVFLVDGLPLAVIICCAFINAWRIKQVRGGMSVRHCLEVFRLQGYLRRERGMRELRCGTATWHGAFL